MVYEIIKKFWVRRGVLRQCMNLDSWQPSDRSLGPKTNSIQNYFSDFYLSSVLPPHIFPIFLPIFCSLISCYNVFLSYQVNIIFVWVILREDGLIIFCYKILKLKYITYKYMIQCAIRIFTSIWVTIRYKRRTNI
jgi:hypothetical protein